MQRDLRTHPRYLEIAEHFRQSTEPGLGRLTDGADVHASADGHFVAVAGSVLEALSGTPNQRIGVLNVESGSLRLVGGPNDAQYARWSPMGAALAFLADPVKRGDSRLYIIDEPGSEPVLHATGLEDVIESLAWSPDGSKLLLQTAGAGA